MIIETRPIFIIDLDGTLFDNTQRRHLVPKENQSDPASWVEFNNACAGDTPIIDNITTVKTLISAGFLGIFVTSRTNTAREATEDQLHSVGLIPHPLVMRDMKDTRPPSEYKAAMLDAIENYYQRKIVAAIDDDSRVCRMMRERGIAVAHVSTKCTSLL